MKLAIFGAAGCAKEVADIALEVGYKEIVFLDYEPSERSILDFRVYQESEAGNLAKEEFRFSIAIGDNHLRKSIYQRFPKLPYVNLIHPFATFGYRQREALQEKSGNIIAAGARFTNSIIFGNFGIFNLNCTVTHDCILEDFVHIGPGANISGNVHLQEGAYIGANACILQGRALNEKRHIGQYSFIGAGAVVTGNVANEAVVKGVPAR